MVGAVTGPTSRGMSEHLAAGGDRRDTNGATEDVGVPSQQRPVRERERQRLAPRDREGADERVAGADSALAMVVEVPAHVNGATGDRDALDVAVGEGDPAAAASHRPIRGDAPAVAADPRNERGRAGAQRLRRPGGVGGIRGNPAGRELSATRCGCALPFTLVKSPPARTRPPPRTVESAFGCHLPSLAVEPVAIATRRWRLLPPDGREATPAYTRLAVTASAYTVPFVFACHMRSLVRIAETAARCRRRCPPTTVKLPPM